VRSYDLAIELAYDPTQPRNRYGRWTGIPGMMAGTPSMKMAQRAGLVSALGSSEATASRLRSDPAREAARMKGVEARQRKSGLWGGRTAKEHEAEVAKLTPAQRAVYNAEQTNGRPLAAALAYAKVSQIGTAARRAFGNPAVKVAGLSGGGTAVLDLASGPIPYRRMPDETVQCPNCQKYNDVDARFCDQCGHKLPDSAFADLSNGGKAVELATRTLTAGQRARTQPARVKVTSPYDIHVSRGPAGQAIIVHRRAGQKIGELVKLADGKYAGKIGETVLTPHTQQRAALFEMIGTHNKNAGQLPSEVQPPAVQTPLMAQYGVPAVQAYANGVQAGISLATATAANSSSDGPRSTSASSDSDGDAGSGPAGLTPKGVGIYKKLLAKGFPAARALLFARRSQSFGGGGSS
jgi:hypothetical protein